MRRPRRIPRCAFTAVIANWVCCLFAMVDMDLVTNLCIGTAIISSGAVPSLSRRVTRPIVQTRAGTGRPGGVSAYSTGTGSLSYTSQASSYVVVALLAAMMLAIVAALALVGPGLATDVSHSVYCMNHAQEAVCS